MDKRTRAITLTSLVALVGNAILAATKITVGFFAGSLSVVGDGIDSSTDVLIAVLTLGASIIMAKPSDKEHPYGHGRAETIATTILAFAIFFAGAQLFLFTIHNLQDPAPKRIPDPVTLWVIGFSIAGKLLLAWSQFSVGRRYKSEMLLANGKNMRNDVLISTAVLLGLFFTLVLNMPLLDPIMALAVGLWIIKTSVGIFIGTNAELMDGVKDQELYRAIFDSVHSVPGAGNPHRARIRKIAAAYVVDLDIEVDPCLTISVAHDIAVSVEQEVRKRIDNVFDVMVHVEPRGNLESDECYGLTEDELDGDSQDKQPS